MVQSVIFQVKLASLADRCRRSAVRHSRVYKIVTRLLLQKAVL